MDPRNLRTSALIRSRRSFLREATIPFSVKCKTPEIHVTLAPRCPLCQARVNPKAIQMRNVLAMVLSRWSWFPATARMGSST